MKWLKIAIITIIILIIIILAVLLHYRVEKEFIDTLPSEVKFSAEGTKIAPSAVETSMYFSIEACVDKILYYSQNSNKEAILSLMNGEYISSNNITQNNVLDVTGLNTIKKYKVIKMYTAAREFYRMYFVQVITDSGYIYLNIDEDLETSSFNFKMLSKEEFEKYISTEIPVYKKYIERNSYNSMPYRQLSIDDVTENYFNDFIENAIEFPEIAYSSLDKEYRDARFGNFEEFKKFISNNADIKQIYEYNLGDDEDYESIEDYFYSAPQKIGIERYNKEISDEYTKYIFIDSYDNTYIFYVTSGMQYTVILDTYTMDLPEFTNKYSTATDQEKVILNINKFALAINNGDYKYAYNKLADGFKENYFPTFDEFTTYIKSNFFAKNNFEYVSYGNEAGAYYTYTVNIKDKSGISTNTLNKTFIMQLGEGTDFKLSFNK